MAKGLMKGNHPVGRRRLHSGFFPSSNAFVQLCSVRCLLHNCRSRELLDAMLQGAQG